MGTEFCISIDHCGISQYANHKATQEKLARPHKVDLVCQVLAFEAIQGKTAVLRFILLVGFARKISWLYFAIKGS